MSTPLLVVRNGSNGYLLVWDLPERPPAFGYAKVEPFLTIDEAVQTAQRVFGENAKVFAE